MGEFLCSFDATYKEMLSKQNAETYHMHSFITTLDAKTTQCGWKVCRILWARCHKSQCSRQVGFVMAFN